MKTTRITDRLRYAFDNYMAKGPIALIGGLALVSGVAIISISSLVLHFNWAPDSPSLAEIAWMGMMRTLDAGTMGGDKGSWPFLFSMFAITLVGVFVISLLIGILTTGIESKLEEMRKGRSVVIESGHTIILGWSPQIFTILSELMIANENVKRACVVILGDKDKVEMEDEIKDNLGRTGHLRVVCRNGNPISMDDLKITSVDTAKSIIILSPEDDDPDISVVKTMLAITNNPNRRPQPYHIVAEIRDSKNLEAAQLVGGKEAELVVTSDLVARIMAQTCRQSGLSIVYTELMDFDGDEIYFQVEPKLVGMTYAEALMAYADSTVIGLQSKDSLPKMNPPMGTIIKEEEAIIVISADDDTIIVSERDDLDINSSLIQSGKQEDEGPEYTLLLGWNWRAAAIIKQLDNYVKPGSKVKVVSGFSRDETDLDQECAGLKNITIDYEHGDTTDRRTLDKQNYSVIEHLIVLGDIDRFTHDQADARTLITLLHLRNIAENAGYNFSIVSEMMDMMNQRLAEVTRADDFVVSSRTVSLLMTQISENKWLAPVFGDIFDPEGSEIYLKPVTRYVKPGEAMKFYTVVEAARRLGHTAIGYKIQALAHQADKNYGVVTNPNKSDRVTFAARDMIIVLAEE